MSKLELIVFAVAGILLFKVIKEIAYIKLYVFMLKLKSEGKLIPENDPKGLVEKAESDLKNNSSKYF